jgi:predicted amidohydrolase YtcJ
MALRDVEQLMQVGRRAAQAGIASQVHAIGDRAVRTALDALARLPRVPGVRHRVEHAQLVQPEDVPRFAQLDVAASVQPCHLLSDAAAMSSAWGTRSAHAFPLAGLDAAGSLLPFGTDAPVESPDPWPGLAAATLRRGAGTSEAESFYPAQSLTLERALRGACLDGPRSAGLDDLGHLDVGARADLLVIPAEVFETRDASVLASARPVATLLDDGVIHRAPDFDR